GSASTAGPSHAPPPGARTGATDAGGPTWAGGARRHEDVHIQSVATVAEQEGPTSQPACTGWGRGLIIRCPCPHPQAVQTES
ncbi:MAG: hypothetical protein ABI274_17320, partial [Ktedonobacterales bacterium]